MFFWSSFSPQLFPLFFLCNLRFLLLLPVILDRKRRATNGQSSFFPLRISIATISLSRKTEKEKKEKSSGEDPALKKLFVGKQSFILFAFSKFAKIGFFIWKIITFSLGVVPSLLPSLLDFLMLGSDFNVGKLTGKGKSVWLVGI